MNQEKLTDDRYLDLAHLASYSSMGKTTLRELIQAGELQAFCPRGKVLVKKSTFDSWVEKHPVRPGKAVADLVNEIMAKVIK